MVVYLSFMLLEFKVNIKTDVAYGWQGKVFKALAVAGVKGCFRVDVRYVFMDDPQVTANSDTVADCSPMPLTHCDREGVTKFNLA
jgi:hypothetical protein